jgi:hypothetical protein
VDSYEGKCSEVTVFVQEYDNESEVLDRTGKPYRYEVQNIKVGFDLRAKGQDDGQGR